MRFYFESEKKKKNTKKITHILSMLNKIPLDGKLIICFPYFPQKIVLNISCKLSPKRGASWLKKKKRNTLSGAMSEN